MKLVSQKTQTKISRYTTNTPQLFHFSDTKNRDELTKMVSVEHLSFSFGKKLSFINYYQNALNSQVTRVSRITLTRTAYKLCKKNYLIFSSFFMDVSLYVVIYRVITGNDILTLG